MDRQALLQHYVNNLGWSLCYCDGKKPDVMGAGWHKKAVAPGDIPANMNPGLNHFLSKTATLDIDHPAAELALQSVGLDLAFLLETAPFKIVGNPERPPKPVYSLPEGVKLTRLKLEWPDPTGAKDDKGHIKRICIFELRGGTEKGFMDVLPPAVHPDTGKVYRWADDNIPQKPEDVPILPATLLTLWQKWAEFEPILKAACPWATPTSPAKSADKTSPKNTTSNGDFDLGIVQEKFNERYKAVDILERNSYKKKGDKYLCPSSSSGNPGVIVLEDDNIMSFHGSDVLGDGKPHDAFDCYRILEHDGDGSKAWHTAKELLGITFAPPTNGNGHTQPASALSAIADSPEDESNGVNYVFQPLSVSELLQRPPKQWLIKDVIGPLDLGMIFSAPGDGKTFVIIDLLYAAALGLPWAGKFEIGRPLKVAYAAGEGIGGLRGRFAAAANRFQAYQNPNLQNLSIFLDSPQLFNAALETSIYRFVNDWKDRQAGALDILTIDTLHSAIFGADENLAKDMGKVLQAAKFASQQLNCAVLFVHHSNKTGGYRGSSALHGAMDVMLEAKYDQDSRIGSVECFKAKDAEHFSPLYFRLVGDPVAESAAVEWVDRSTVDLNDDPAPKTSAAKDYILGLLADKPGLNQSAIVAALPGYGRRTTLRALEELERAGEIVGLDGPRGSKVYELSPMGQVDGTRDNSPI